MKQRTIASPVEISGVGLQTGAKVTLTLKGSPANSGINFIRVDLPDKPVLSVRSLDLSESAMKERRTVLGKGAMAVETTEHFLAALSGLGIDNIIAQINGTELPGMDGSARDFVELLKKARVVEQAIPRKVMEITRLLRCGDERAFLEVTPGEDLEISYTLAYDKPGLKGQSLDIVLNEASFEREIAPARTFCLEEEALELLKRGLGKGANYANTLVIGKDGEPLQNKFRFPDEPVRHKILDLVGDLYLLGMPIKGRIVAMKSGHKLNMDLVKKLKALTN